MKHTVRAISMSLIFAAALSVNAYAGHFEQKDTGYPDPAVCYHFDDGSWAIDQWIWIDDDADGIAECYYFEHTGLMARKKITPDGFRVDENGHWNIDGVVQTRTEADPEPAYNAADAALAAQMPKGRYYYWGSYDRYSNLLNLSEGGAGLSTYYFDWQGADADHIYLHEYQTYTSAIRTVSALNQVAFDNPNTFVKNGNGNFMFHYVQGAYEIVDHITNFNPAEGTFEVTSWYNSEFKGALTSTAVYKYGLFDENGESVLSDAEKKEAKDATRPQTPDSGFSNGTWGWDYSTKNAQGSSKWMKENGEYARIEWVDTTGYGNWAYFWSDGYARPVEMMPPSAK